MSGNASDALPPATVAAVLHAAQQAGIDRLDAHLLLTHVTGRSRTWLMAHGEAVLDEAQAGAWHAALARRASGEPLAYVLGEKEFFGLKLQVGPSVLVPRPDTETLVEWALQIRHAGGGAASPRVVDLGTGSGAIALALKHAWPEADVCAVDASASALALAEENGRRLGLPVHWRLGDWWSATGTQRFDLAVSNPPYIAEGDPHLAALRHEPISALTSGVDGLSALRDIVGAAPAHLHPGAWLLIEHGHEQAGAVQTLLTDAGFDGVQTRPDLAGRPRCSGGRWTTGRN